MKFLKTKQGFTLIELLIVIAIIAVLAVALIGPISTGPVKARDAARLVNLSAVSTAIETFNVDFGQYPASTGDCVSAIFLDPADGTTDVSLKYFTNIPSDPSGTRSNLDADVGTCAASGEYYYEKYAVTDPGQYVLGTVMEIPESNNSDDTVATDGGPYDTDPANCTDACGVFLIVK